MSGHKIIEGLRDAVAGNFARVTIDGQIWVKRDSTEVERLEDIAESARDLVALWESPVIQGLARADRNAAIEETKAALIEAVNATVAQSAERRLCKAKVGGSNPPGGTIYQALRDSVLEQAAKNLAQWYPGNASTNAFCAAIRSMKGSAVPSADRS